MMRFSISYLGSKIFLTLRIPLKEGLGGERRPKDRVTLQISLVKGKEKKKPLNLEEVLLCAH